MIAGSLEIQMLANMAELKKQMDQGVGIVKGASEQMQKAADLAGRALGMIGVTLTIGAFTGFIKNAINAADALDEMSGRVGVSAKELSQLKLAYQQAGMSEDAMTSSLTRLSKEMSDGNAGLRALGVNAKNTDGSLRSTTSVLLEVADKFTALEDGAGKTALAVEIFGKSGAEMVPLLNSGSEGIRELTEMSEKLGLVIEDETAAKAGQFNDTLELMQLGVQGVGARVAAQLLPTLNNLTGSFLESMTSGERLNGVANALAAGMKILYTAGVAVVEVFSTLGKAGETVWGPIKRQLDSTPIASWEDYFFAPFDLRSTFLELGIPTYTDGVLRVQIDSGTPIGIGKLIVGDAIYIGDTKVGPRVRRRGFSTVDRDDYGELRDIVPRKSIPLVSQRMLIEKPSIQRARAALDFAASGVPCVFVGLDNDQDEYADLLTLVAICTDFEFELVEHELSELTLETEGV